MSYEPQPEGTFRGLIELRSPGWLRGDTTSAFFQVILGVPADEGIEGCSIAAQMHLLDAAQSPDDILPIKGADRLLDRYDLETADQHRDRLLGAWDIYETGGSATSIETQLRAAGYGPAADARIGTWGASGFTWGQAGLTWGDMGAFVQFRPDEPGPRGEPAPYATQFWIVFSHGFHPITGGAKPWGTFTWGDTWPVVPGVWALTGLTPGFYRTIMSIALKWKCSRYVLRGFTFRTGGITVWGEAGHTWGEAGSTWGGSFELPIPLAANRH
jgi:hypothetical protein